MPRLGRQTPPGPATELQRRAHGPAATPDHPTRKTPNAGRARRTALRRCPRLREPKFYVPGWPAVHHGAGHDERRPQFSLVHLRFPGPANSGTWRRRPGRPRLVLCVSPGCPWRRSPRAPLTGSETSPALHARQRGHPSTAADLARTPAGRCLTSSTLRLCPTRGTPPRSRRTRRLVAACLTCSTRPSSSVHRARRPPGRGRRTVPLSAEYRPHPADAARWASLHQRLCGSWPSHLGEQPRGAPWGGGPLVLAVRACLSVWGLDLPVRSDIR